MKVTVVLCEGAHDVAFLSRVLETMDFEEYSGAIRDMPQPFKRYIPKKLKKYNYRALTLNNLRPPLPTMIMKRAGDNVLLLLYAIGGVDNLKIKGKEILKDYLDWLPETRYKNEIGYPNMYSFAFFLDGDNKKISSRLKAIKNLLEYVFKGIDTSGIGHNKVFNWENTLIGCFIISDDQCKNLEDVILPLMEKGNELIFFDARGYYQKHCQKNKKEKENKGKKAIIGIAGQLQKSGFANPVIIRASRYITPKKITANDKCKEIIDFFNRLI